MESQVWRPLRCLVRRLPGVAAQSRTPTQTQPQPITPPQAYNKRATVAYLQQRFHDAVADCKRTLELNPLHFAAAAGLGMSCAAVGDIAGAVAGYQHALALNPRLRHLRTHIRMLQEQQAERRPSE